jgi:cytochrome c oxidase assembly factor 6
MGWFTTDRSESIRTGTAVPTRSERQKCWLARDTYFACLDAHSVDDPLKHPSIDKKECRAESAQMDTDCAREWVKYFKQWRVADLQKRRRLEELRKQGAVEMEVTSSFAPEGGAKETGKGVADIQGMLEKQQRR